MILCLLLKKKVYLCKVMYRKHIIGKSFRMELKTLIAECTAYDFKVMLEEKKPKSWLKSVSAFANGLGGSLFFGIDNDGIVKGMGSYFSKCLFVAFGNHDFRIMAQSLAHNLDVNKEDIETVIKHQFDLAEFLSNYVKDENNNNLSLANFLKVFKIDFKGTQHNALADTLNLVYLYDAFLKNTEIVVNEYRKTLGMYRHLPEPIHLAIEKLSRQENVSAEEFESYVRDSLK